MDLRTGPAYWFLENGLMQSYPALEENVTCEVAIIGGGITGALIGYQLAKNGVQTVLLEKNDVISGSTAASTSLLQYATDTELLDLIAKVGEEDAVRSYRLGLEAIEKLESFANEVGGDCSFERRPTLYFASKASHVKKLKEEYECRKKFGFSVEFLDSQRLTEEKGLTAPAALLSHGDGVIDVYRFAHRLLASAAKHGMQIFDRTNATEIRPSDQHVVIETDRDFSITARRIVFATGYESQKYLKKTIGPLHSTFACISEPMNSLPLKGEDCLMWETARPYFYLRTTPDRRVLIGGEDSPFATAHRQESLVDRRCVRLRKRFEELFPDRKFEAAYSWAGTFGETSDGLAYIGESPEWPNAYFALGFGGNGITMSMIASDLIVNDYLGRPNPDFHIFRFER